MTRKIIALVMAYLFFATSVWSLALPAERGMTGRSFSRVSSLGGPVSNRGAGHSPDSDQGQLKQKIFTNFAALRAATMPPVQSGGGASATVNFFGPQQYVRTTGAPNTYTTTVQVPAWVVNPFNLHIQSGEADGSFRVSSAIVTVNNVQVAGTSDFNQNVFTLDRSVTLTPTTTLVVTLASKPGSYLRINLTGSDADHTPPIITIAAPAADINTPRAHFDIQYRDPVGAGEPAASGVNTSTLKVLIDGVDRTSLFTERTDEATADLPASLALPQGSHRVDASIQDNAGNTGQASLQFEVDTTPPVIQIQQPAANSFLNSTTPQVVLTYSDNFALDLGSLKVTDNGIDITSSFTKTASQASGTTPALTQGGNTIVATISDQAGNPATASVTFNVDTSPPTIQIVHPVQGSIHGSAGVDYLIQYSDDQAIDLNTLVVKLDGNAVGVTPGAASISGTLTVPDGTGHQLTASIKDKAGNSSPIASATFTVDTTFPNVHIVTPVNNSAVNNPTPPVQVQYDESISGLDLSTFKATVDGNDLTPLFSVGANSASATLQNPLADGSHTFAAQIASAAGKLGTASNQVLIDTVKPQVTIVSPVGPVNTTTPAALAQYSDLGSGIDRNSVHVTLDNVDITGTLGVTTTSASGTLGSGAGLSETTHTLAISVADKAGNVALPASTTFTVDVTPPTGAFSSPADNSFINNPQPTITLTYSDPGSGSGVDPNSIHVFLAQGTAAETEITSLFTFGATQGTATIPASSPLVPGTYHLRAVLADKAGNPATPAPRSDFALDTTPPTYTIVAPAANAFLNTSTPTFIVTYSDDSSGVDTSKFALQVDGQDRTNSMSQITGTGASGTLLASDALADGNHQVSVTVVDRAGNAAPIIQQPFLVDTIPPTISITAPAAGAFTNNNRTPVSITYADTGSGIDVTTFQLLVDGNDHTADLTVTATGASGSLASSLVDGSHSIIANIKDFAGNPASATTPFAVDTVPPQVTISQPVDGSFTSATSVTVTGTVTSAAPVVSLTVNGASTPFSGTSFTSAPIPLGADGSSTAITVVATDAAGNSSQPKTVTVNVDRTPPQIIISQPVDGSFTNATSVVVSGTVTSTAPVVSLTINGTNTPLSGNSFTSAPIPLGADGSSTTITVVATDAAGNSSQPKTVTVRVDRAPPHVTITQPVDGSFTNATSIIASGTVTSAAPVVSLTVNGANATLSGNSFSSAPIPLGADGTSQAITAIALDAAGNSALSNTVTVNIDRTPPTITLTTPDIITPLHPGQITATVQDVAAVTQVVISLVVGLNNTVLATLTSPPYQANLAVPTGANPGDTVTVTATVTDVAGNSASAIPHSVRVGADGGVIVGQVLDDVTGLPLGNASVQMIPATGLPIQTDDQGRYSLQASSSHLFLSLNVPPSPPTRPTGTTTVEREVLVQPGVGTVPVDARLTALSPAVSIGTAGGTLSAGAISISVAANSVSSGTTFQLTPLSGQGLPNLLPLGWSVLAAFDLRSSGSPANLTTTIAQLPNTVAHLVGYSPALHAWTMVAPNLQVANGSLSSVPLPGVGAFAIVTPDTTTPPIPVPDIGGALTGIAVQALDPAASGTINLNPPVLPAGGGTSTATVNLQAPTLSPSGTVIQANVSEKFSLASGDTVSEETRSEDIVLYNALASASPGMVAQFPLTPSHTYTNAQLVSGNLHLDILSGREGVRGQSGGNDPVTVTDPGGIATLAVPGHALGVDTAISVQSITLENFVPTSSSMSAIQEVLVDFSGEVLNTPAQLSISSSGLSPSHTFLLTQVQRINGVPHIVAVAVAQLNGSTLTSVASPGLPGVIQGGEYVFYDIASPAGFVTGVAKTNAGPVQALVQTDLLQIVSITGADGHYILPGLAGTVHLKANGTTSSVAGTASTQLTASQIASVDIQLNGVVNAASVSPADTSLGVPTSTIITITSPVPIDSQSIVPSNLVLFQGTAAAPGAAVPLQPFILSTSGTVLTFAPSQNLAPATQYTIQVTGLADFGHGAIVVPTSSFTTKANQPLTFDPNQITFSFPDQNGNIQVSAPAGSLPSGTKVLIVDQSNAVVLSLTAFNDGSLSGQFPGTINDTLQVTATDPNGATISFTRSQFVAADGSVAVGLGGGTVTGSGGVELRIPSGTFDKAVTFQIQSFGPDLFPDQPPLPGSNFGSGMKIQVDHIPTFKNELKLAFAKPVNAPDGAFYYVYRRLQGPNGAVLYETLDHAFIEGQGATAKVVTASPPFPGYADNTGTFNLSASGGVALGGALITYLVLAWTVNPAGPGIPLPGVVTGRVRRSSFDKNGQPQFQPVPGIVVTAADSSGRPIINLGGGTTNADGTFVLWAPFFHGGSTVSIVACDIPFDGACHQATASEIVVADTNTINFAGPLLQFYRNVAAADIAFPPIPPQQPPPQLTLSVATRNADGSTTPVGGAVLVNTPVVITARSNSTDPSQILSVPGGTVQGANYDVTPDPTDPTKFVFTPDFTPALPGLYTAAAKAIPPLGGPPISAQVTFFVIAAGGGNDQTTAGKAPDVVTAQLVPQPNAIDVPTSVLPQVVFSEPVNNVASNTFLYETDQAGQANVAQVPITIAGVGVVIDAQGNRTDQAIAKIGDTDNITSITIQPLEALKFGTFYKISLGQGIADLNKDASGNPAPLHLVGTPPNREFLFQTFPLQSLSSTGSFAAQRIAVVAGRAYAAVPSGVNSLLLEYDVSDPVHPVQVNVGQAIPGRAADLGSEEAFSDSSPTVAGNFTGGIPTVNSGGGTLGLLAVATGAGIFPMPSNIFFYDASKGDNVHRIGAVSVTGSASQEGTILRMVLKDAFAYTSTFQKGIQVVDINQAIQNYTTAVQTDIRQFGVAVSTDGEGFGRDAVIATIPVTTNKFNSPQPVPATLFDLKARDLPVNQQVQTLVVATGVEALVVVDPVQGQIVSQLSNIQVTPTAILDRGFAVDAGIIPSPCPSGRAFSLTSCSVAVVVGTSTGAPMLAIVDLTDPANPVPFGKFGLPEFGSDVILKDNLALVAQPTKTLLIDLTDPGNPQLLGSIDGVGGRLTLAGLLYSTSFGPLTGLNIASLGGLAYVKSFEPNFIVVSPSNEVFTNVRINYAIIPPDPSFSKAEVHIDASGAGRTATLAGTLTAGNGSVVWRSGTIVLPSQTYLATVHTSASGGELPTTAVRVPLVKVPIAVAPRDRMLRIQVALPDQQLFVDSQGNVIDKYSVQVYLNADGSGSPAFTVKSSDIANAYVNDDAWFSTTADGTGATIQDGSTQGTSPWVTRKIDGFATPQGLNNPVRMQAFEIGTVMALPTAIFVRVVSEKTGQEVAKLPAATGSDSNWAQIVDQVAAYVDENPTPTQNGIPGVFDNSSMIFRVLHTLDQASQQFGLGILQGLLDGFKDGAEGDINMVGQIFDAVLHPVKTAIALYQFVVKVCKALGQFSFIQTIQSLYGAAGNLSWPTLDQTVLIAQKGGYFLGYICGFVLEQVLSAVILALISAGVAAVAQKVLALLKGFAWVASLISKAVAILRFLGYWLETLAKAAADSKLAKAVVGFLRDSQDLIAAIADKYPAADKVMKALATTWQTSTKLAGKALEWLSVVNKMQDAAAERFVNFLLSKGETDSEALVGRWLAFQNGKRSIADGVESYEGFVGLTEGAADALVTAAEQIDTDTAKLAKQFADRYKATAQGDRVGSSLGRVRAFLGDTRYPDDAIGSTVKVLGNPAAVTVSDQAVEGAARFEKAASGKFALADREDMLVDIAQSPTGADNMLQFAQAAPDDGVVAGMADMVQGATCPLLPSPL